MNISAKALLTVILPALLLAAHARAQEQSMYTWTDENGVVHFSDVQPQGQQAKEQQVPRNESTAGVGVGPDVSSANTDSSYADQRRAQIAADKQSAKQKQAANSARCASWKAQLDRLEPNRRVFFTNADGETERMDDVERADQVAQLKQRIAENCP